MGCEHISSRLVSLDASAIDDGAKPEGVCGGGPTLGAIHGRGGR